ncbi:MAG TPA: sialidase family protein [Cyclobacteriaceae bacterium]|nr:sialidase family protein [Cyclobacteriaceae bacterium]
MRKNLLAGLLVFSAGLAQGQFKNILLDPEGGTEPGIAVNHSNPKNIVAGSAPNHVYSTIDGGLTWEKSTLKSTLGVAGDPLVVSDIKGTFYYFHLSDPTGKNRESDEFLDRILVQESGDGGKSWSEAVSIGLNPPKDHDNESAVVDRKGNWYLTWTQFDKYGDNDPACQSNILLSTSSNGKKWSKPIQLSQTPGNCKSDNNTVRGSVPTVTADGTKAFVAWSNQNRIFLDRSFDGGKTWLTNDIGIIEQTGGWSLNIPGLRAGGGMPVLVCDNTKKGRLSGALFIVWADLHNGTSDSDVWFMRSTNFGDNWTQPQRINNDEKGKHQFMPSITVDPTNGNIYIIYYDRRAYNDLQTDVYVGYSTDGGVSFKNVKVSEKPFTPNAEFELGDRISISASQGIITPVWTRMDDGKTSIWTAVIRHEELEKIK